MHNNYIFDIRGKNDKKPLLVDFILTSNKLYYFRGVKKISEYLNT